MRRVGLSDKTVGDAGIVDAVIVYRLAVLAYFFLTYRNRFFREPSRTYEFVFESSKPSRYRSLFSNPAEYLGAHSLLLQNK